MPVMPRAQHLLLIFLFLLIVSATVAQQQCALPVLLKPLPPGKNIFSGQQESDLGDIEAESLAASIPMFEDDSLQDHLRQVGGRLALYLPVSGFRIRFFLVELPEANAFSLPGGRVYVSRKLVAMARSDDELAGILAHELGHIVTHQGAADMTRLFREVLHVTEVGDRADIADKFHRFLETWRTKPVKGSFEHEEEEQYVADSVALFAVMRAGYAPKAYVDVLDRLQQTRGKTGSWLSDLLEDPKPEQVRLRKVLKSLSSLPPGCVDVVPPSRLSDFQQWQAAVIAYDIHSHHESLPGLVFKQSLALPLRPEVKNLRFSPDGKFVLAQDAGGIHILSRDPLAFLFFIDAPDAYAASFSPDSKSVAFYTPSFRVEVWDIANRHRTSVHEMAFHEPCAKSALSPDGSFLACLAVSTTFSVFDVASGDAIGTKRAFFEAPFDFPGSFFLAISAANLCFSPDGRYLLAGSITGAFAFDLLQKREVPLPSSIRNLVRGDFTFVGPDRIVGIDINSPERSPMLRFPTGERLQQFALSHSVHVGPPTHGDYFMIGPLKENPLGVMEIRTSRILSFKRDTLDVYDGIVLHELNDGQIALSDLTSQKTLASIQLKQTRLGGISAIAVSDDFERLAVSTRARGAVWDLPHNTQVNYVRGFNGAWFGPDHSLYADFPKNGPQERAIGRLSSSSGGSIVYTIGEKQGHQDGPYFIAWNLAGDEKAKTRAWTIDVHDYINDSAVWSRRFPAGFPIMKWDTTAGTVLVGGPVYSDAVQEELKQFPDLKKADKDGYFLELLDVRKNVVAGKLVIKTNKFSFTLNDAVAENEWIVTEVSGGRVVSYRISSGEETGHIFGTNAVLSAASGLFAVSSTTSEVSVYQLADTRLRRQMAFSAPIAYKRFSPDGKRLFVLTRDQTAYIFDVADVDQESGTPGGKP